MLNQPNNDRPAIGVRRLRFSLTTLFWLVFAVSVVAAVAGNFGIHFLAAGVLGAYLFAPLSLTLISSLAQGISSWTRLRWAYRVLGTLGGLTVLISIRLSLIVLSSSDPYWGLTLISAVGLAIFGLWSAQIPIMKEVHEQQS